jgi:hypothetical protein
LAHEASDAEALRAATLTYAKTDSGGARRLARLMVEAAIRRLPNPPSPVSA